MKLTKARLRQIIKEEINSTVREGDPGHHELAGDMYAIWRDEMLAGGWATPNEWPYAGPKMQATWVAIAERTKAVIR